MSEVASFLSRVWINPQRRQGQRFLRDRQALHAAVLSGIPTQPVEERVLWRLDLDHPSRAGLIVLSRSQPSWEHVVEQAGWPSAAEPQITVRPYGPVLDRLTPGREFAFRLTANPVRSSRAPERPTAGQRRRQEEGVRPRSARLAHRTPDQQVAWLASRASGWGFSLPESSASSEMGESVADVRVAGSEQVSFRRGRSGPPVTLQVTTFEGRLTVVDGTALAASLLDGMGKAKAYGCGLMTLAPMGEARAT